jgi:hypothetical protein
MKMVGVGSQARRIAEAKTAANGAIGGHDLVEFAAGWVNRPAREQFAIKLSHRSCHGPCTADCTIR